MSSVKQRMFGNYENRIREMSSPEKVFQVTARALVDAAESREF